MVTDIAGSTAQAQSNEKAALDLVEIQRGLARPLLATHHGKKIKDTGDGLLLSFPDALDAVEFGVSLLRKAGQHNMEEGARSLLIRIGVNLGDAERKGKDILGDAVNVAFRLEPFAKPGGMCISSQVYDAVFNKVKYKFEKLEGLRPKGIQEPMDAYQVVLPWEEHVSGPNQSSAARLESVRPRLHLRYVDDFLGQNGWTSQRLVGTFLRIDKDVVQDLSAEDEGTVAQWAPRVRIYPDFYRVVLDQQGEIVAYWHFVPLNERDYLKAEAGKLRERDIDWNMVCPMNTKGDYRLYFVAIMVTNTWQASSAFDLLFDSFLQDVTEYASDGKMIRAVCTNALNSTGVRMCRYLGLHRRGPHVNRGMIYSGTVSEIARAFRRKRYRELFRLYGTEQKSQKLRASTRKF